MISYYSSLIIICCLQRRHAMFNTQFPGEFLGVFSFMKTGCLKKSSSEKSKKVINETENVVSFYS